MAKKEFMFNLSKQTANDFDPVTVYDGISDIDNQLEELEEELPDDREEDKDEVNEQLDYFLENNKKLVIKIRAVADIVAQGVRKAVAFKNQNFSKSHRIEPNDTDYRAKRKILNKLEAQWTRYKKRLDNAKSRVELVVDQQRITDLINQQTVINTEVDQCNKLIKILKVQLEEVKVEKKKVYTNSNIEDKSNEYKQEIKKWRKQLELNRNYFY